MEEAIEEFPHLIDTSLYWKQINYYRNYYEDNKILILFFEDFVGDPRATLLQCWNFLGVDPFVVIGDAEKPLNVSRERFVERPLGRVARRLMLTDKLSAMPGGFRIMYRPFTERAKWSDKLYRHVISEITIDTRNFLGFYGKPQDYWSIDTVLF